MPSLLFSRLGIKPTRLFRELELDMETVIKVLQPGPLGIIEHKFSAQEIHEAKTTVKQAVENWQRHAALEINEYVTKGRKF